jgi:hypothetical protein
MPELSSMIKWELGVFLLALGGIVLVQLLTGSINTHNLLCGRIAGPSRKQDRHYFSPERVQLLILTLAAALNYLELVFTNSQPGKFPEVPQIWPAIVGGSNFIYLGGKAYTRWLGREASADKKEGQS